MTTYVPTLDQRELSGLVDDIRQMTSPWRLATAVEHAWWDRNRNRKTRLETVVQRQDPLLDQLRSAAAGGLPQHVPAGSRPERKPKLGPKMPPGWNEAASSRLAGVYVGVSGWHARLGAPPVPRFRYGHGCGHSSCRELLARREGPLCRRAGLIEFEVDWHRTVLRWLGGRAPKLDRVVAEELAGDVREWWTWCVTQSGLSPVDLLDQRSGS